MGKLEGVSFILCHRMNGRYKIQPMQKKCVQLYYFKEIKSGESLDSQETHARALRQ